MSYQVELETQSNSYRFHVKDAYFDGGGIRFTGCPPNHCPQEIHELFRFMRKGSRAILTDRDQIEQITINP